MRQALNTLLWLLRGTMSLLPKREATYTHAITPEDEPSVVMNAFFAPTIWAMSFSAAAIMPEGHWRSSEKGSSVISFLAMGKLRQKEPAALCPGM